ncbi:MAG: hypothetical protein ACRDHK_03520 [Actinomycetota bacterium]
MPRALDPVRSRPRRLRRLGALALLAGGLAAALLAGCAKKRILPVGNLPPETTLFVSGSLDTVNHIVRLYWFGSDPDGDIAGFELRFRNPAAPADTDWVFTTRSDSTFTIFAPSGFAMPVFEVRAIDDGGTRDPSPARQDFQFSNQAPSVTFVNRLRTNDTTYASATLEWAATDVDGDEGALRFLVGLDTVPSALRLVTGRRFTVDTTDFKVAGAYPPTQPRMAFIRAIDDGGRISPWDSVRWVVRAPSTLGQRPRLLIIDDVPRSGPGTEGNLAAHNLWVATASRNLPAGSYSILQLEWTQPFRSAKDVAQTCRQFDAVVWYRDLRTSFATPLVDYQDGLSTYLDGGGRLLLESRELIDGENAPGLLRADWTSRYFGSTDLIRSPISGRTDSTVSWSIVPSVNLNSTVYDEIMRNGPNLGGLRGFAVRDTNFVALWARDSSLSPQVDRDIPVAVTVPAPEGSSGSGRVVAFTFPIRGTNGFGNLARFLDKVFQQLGLTGP